MSYSGATQLVELARARSRGWLKRPAAGWGRAAETVWGPLLTLAVIITLDQLTRAGTPVLYPFTILLFSVVISSSLGGLKTGLISAVLTVLYAVHFFALPGFPLRYRPSGEYSLLMVAFIAPLSAMIVARLRSTAVRGREAELGREEAEALDRRLSFLSQANSTLASSLDYEVSLRELVRMVVPTLGDWCAIHAIDERGTVRFVAGAHRDPARDLMVRVLCERGERRLPFGVPVEGDRTPMEVTEELLRTLAEDDEHRKLYRALKPSWTVRLPLSANGRLAGVITLVMGQEYGRRFSDQDMGYARELADRCALAIGAGQVYHEARETDRRYRLLFDANPQPMWVFDVRTLDFLAVNDAAVQHYGYSRAEFLCMSIMDIHPFQDEPGLPLPDRNEEAAFTRHQRKDGTVMDVELVSHELEMDGRKARLVLATDISNQTRVHAALRHSEEQLRHVQRLDAVGRLAIGVAHDFNNVLTTVRGFGELLVGQLDDSDPRRADAEQIRTAADRGVRLTDQLLALGQRDMPSPRLLDLNQSIRSMEGLIQRLLGADIELEMRLLQGTAMLRIDPGHLDQLLVNIILNARDAMPRGGRLTVETAERRIGAGAKARRLRPGSFAMLAIRDTGSGMDAEARRHLFEPFYQTDPRLHRAGLGLSIVHGIVRQYGGVVRVSSEPEQGTSVKVYLPVAEMEEAAEEPTTSLRGNETVLVVEDEDAVRDLLRQILSEHGHVVLTARHGRDALLLAEQYQRAIELLVTDVVMPHMGGGELVKRLTAVRPDLKVLYISGYTNDEVLRRGIAGTPSVLHKPFSTTTLMRRVRDALDGEPAPI